MKPVGTFISISTKRGFNIRALQEQPGPCFRVGGAGRKYCDACSQRGREFCFLILPVTPLLVSLACGVIHCFAAMANGVPQ